MIWEPFYRILQRNHGRLDHANPMELQDACRENLKHGYSPTEAYRLAYEFFVKDRNLNI